MKFLMSVVVFLHFPKKKKVTILTTGGKRKASLFYLRGFVGLGVSLKCKLNMENVS